MRFWWWNSVFTLDFSWFQRGKREREGQGTLEPHCRKVYTLFGHPPSVSGSHTIWSTLCFSILNASNHSSLSLFLQPLYSDFYITFSNPWYVSHFLSPSLFLPCGSFLLLFVPCLVILTQVVHLLSLFPSPFYFLLSFTPSLLYLLPSFYLFFPPILCSLPPPILLSYPFPFLLLSPPLFHADPTFSMRSR
jgi:hypothetical protein